MSLLKACNSGVAPTVDLTQGQVAHYLLNNNADDSHGTYDGIPSSGVDFQGDVAKFDGAGSINVSQLPNTIPDTFTFSGWLDLQNETESFMFMHRDDTTTLFQISITDSKLTLQMRTLTYALVTKQSTVLIPSNGIHNVVITINMLIGQCSMYIDGVFDSSHTFVMDNSFLSGSTYINTYDKGVFGDIEANDFHIPIYSNFRIYNEVKDQTFIDALYAEGYYPKTLPLPTTNGLLAHFKLTGTAEDETGNYDGIETNMSYVDTAEKGSAGDFQGTTAVTSITTGDIPINPSTGYTISLWLKREGVNGGGIVMGLDIGAYEFSYAISINGTNFAHRPITTNPPIGGYVAGEHGLGDSFDFAHFVLVRDGVGNQARLYVNNSQLTEVYTGTLQDTLRYIKLIGTRFDENTYNIDGQIQDVRIYNRPLTVNEITDIYNYEKNFRPIDIDEGLVAFYPLANNSLDNCKNQYDGTDTAMTYDGLSGIFNGTTSRISTSTYFLNGLTEVSVSFWCKLNNLTGDQAIVSRWATSASILLYHDDPLGWRMFLRHTDGNSRIFETGVVASSNTLYHIVITFDNTGLYKLYINGIYHSEALTLATTTFNSTVNALDIGHDSNTRLLDGELSKSRIYNKAITAEQVAAIYNTEKGDFGL